MTTPTDDPEPAKAKRLKFESSKTASDSSLNLSPRFFHYWARDFLEAQRDHHKPERSSPASYFLLFTAIELEIKSRLLMEHDQAQVKEYGHDLIQAYKALPLDQRILDPKEEEVLKRAGPSYSQLRYWNPEAFLRGYKDFPDLNVLTAIAERLLDQAPDKTSVSPPLEVTSSGDVIVIIS